MGTELERTWNQAARRYEDYGPPLRPSPQDIQLLRSSVDAWRRRTRTGSARVFLCGVTPDIVRMDWPLPVEILGMDQAEEMVRHVWPGDGPDRHAVVGDWLHSGLPDSSQDIVVGDGGFAFLDYPNTVRALMAELRRVLAPGGLFLYRHYAPGEQPERVEAVLSDAAAGRIGSFHAFKWRLAMAMQPDSRTGVRQNDIWTAWCQSGIDPNRLPQPGWSEQAVRTIELYREKQARLYFPTVPEFTSLLEEHYTDVEIQFPSYELGERCPHLSARPRA